MSLRQYDLLVHHPGQVVLRDPLLMSVGWKHGRIMMVQTVKLCLQNSQGKFRCWEELLIPKTVVAVVVAMAVVGQVRQVEQLII
jgi:hypothetical protein